MHAWAFCAFCGYTLPFFRNSNVTFWGLLWPNGAGIRIMTKLAQTHQEAIRSIERLHRILEAAKLLNSTLDLAELTSIILRIIRDEIGTERGTVFVRVRNGRQLRSLVAH